MLQFENLKQKKQELDRYLPFHEYLQKNLNDWYCVELAYTSNAIEGNPLSREETALVIEKGLTGSSKPLFAYKEAQNHANAFYLVLDKIEKKETDITESLLLQIQQTILKGIDDTHGGRYRSVTVRVMGSTVFFPNPLKVPDLMAEFVNWLKNEESLNPVELAALAHYKLVSIHPFVDGNGRTARLLMNLILGLHGYPPVIIDIKEKKAYLAALEKAQIGGSLEDFYSLIYKGSERSLNDYLKVAKESS